MNIGLHEIGTSLLSTQKWRSYLTNDEFVVFERAMQSRESCEVFLKDGVVPSCITMHDVGVGACL